MKIKREKRKKSPVGGFGNNLIYRISANSFRGNYSREETIFFLLTNKSYLPLQKLYGLNEKLFEFEIHVKKDAKIEAKKDAKIQAKKDFEIQEKKDAKIQAKNSDFEIQTNYSSFLI
jgi:hypothetical protein